MLRPEPAVRPDAELRADHWRGRRDVALVVGLVVAGIVLAVAPLPGGERVIPFTALGAVALGWWRSLSERWSTTGAELTHRGWLGRQTLTVTTSTRVELTADEHGPDQLLISDSSARVVLGIDDLRSSPAFAAALLRLVASAEVPAEAAAVIAAATRS